MGHPFMNNHGTPSGLFDGEVVGDQRFPRLLAVLDLNRHRTVGAARHEFPGSSAAIPGMPKAGPEALCQECEHVKDRGLAAPVGAEQYRHRLKVPELHILQRTEVSHLEAFDTCGWSCPGAWVDHV